MVNITGTVLHKALAGAVGPLGTLERLTKGALTSEIRKAVVGLVTPHLRLGGFSGRQILGLLRGSGLGIRTQDFYSVQRGVQPTVDTWAYSQGLTSGDRLDQSMFRAAPQHTPRRYTAIVEYTFRDPLTGETRTNIAQIAARPGWTMDTVLERLPLTLDRRSPAAFEEWDDLVMEGKIIDLWDRGY